MTFKDALPSTKDIFFDVDVFADSHSIEYRDVDCVIDTDINGKSSSHDMSRDEVRIFIAVEECDSKGLAPKSQGETLNVDGTEYFIESWSHEDGVYVIYLNRYGSQVML